MGGKQLLRSGATTSGTPPLPSDDLFLVESVQSIPYKVLNLYKNPALTIIYGSIQ